MKFNSKIKKLELTPCEFREKLFLISKVKEKKKSKKNPLFIHAK